MKKDLVFDMSRVLMEFDTGRYARLAGVPDEYVDEFCWEVFRRPEWLMIERCAISPADAAEAMCRNLPEFLHPCVKATVFGWWKQPIIPMQGMEELLRELKENGYSMYLLSNARREAGDFFKKIPGWDVFTGTLFSYEVKVLKPQRQIFFELYDRFGLNPSNCLFIDDVNSNVEAARSTGMDGIVFRSDIRHLRKALIEKGIEISP